MSKLRANLDFLAAPKISRLHEGELTYEEFLEDVTFEDFKEKEE